MDAYLDFFRSFLSSIIVLGRVSGKHNREQDRAARGGS
jgi:hypothetical protein